MRKDGSVPVANTRCDNITVTQLVRTPEVTSLPMGIEFWLFVEDRLAVLPWQRCTIEAIQIDGTKCARQRREASLVICHIKCYGLCMECSHLAFVMGQRASIFNSFALNVKRTRLALPEMNFPTY